MKLNQVRQIVIGLASTALVLSSPRPAPAQLVPTDAELTVIADSLARDLLSADPPVAGVSIAVSRGNEIILDRSWGFRVIEDSVALQPTDPLQIGSVTKQFTAATIMRMVEEGRVALDAPVQRYLPDFSTQDQTVTIRHLLNHTSGIHSYTSIFGVTPVPRELILDSIQSHPFDFEPGTGHLYNNSGYYLLGMVIESVTDSAYAEVIRRNIVEPVGLSRTSYCGDRGADVPSGYAPFGSHLTPSVLSDMDYPGAAGALCSTASDLLRWQLALVNGTVVRDSSYVQMRLPTTLRSGEVQPYGFGLQIGEMDGKPVVSHGGGINGFNSLLTWYPIHQIGIAVIANTNTGSLGALEANLARGAMGFDRLVKLDLPLTAEERGRYVGTYDIGILQMRVFEEDDALMVEPTGQRALRMMYQGDDVFRPDIALDIRIEFSEDGERAERMRLFQSGQEFEGGRVE